MATTTPVYREVSIASQRPYPTLFGGTHTDPVVCAHPKRVRVRMVVRDACVEPSGSRHGWGVVLLVPIFGIGCVGATMTPRSQDSVQGLLEMELDIMPAQVLEGQRLLLILIDRAHPESTYLLTGVGRWTGSQLDLFPDGGAASVSIGPSDLELNSFSPEMLPRLIGNQQYLPMVEQIQQEVVRCVAMLIDHPPESAVPTPGLIGGLVTGQDGRLFLMQVR